MGQSRCLNIENNLVSLHRLIIEDKHSSLNLRNDMHFTFSKPSQSEDHRTFVLSDDLDAGA
jgi:hypothetical protein